MVQLRGMPIKQPSTKERFADAFAGLGSGALNQIPQIMAQRAQQQQMQSANEQIKKLTGMDLNDIQDPNLRKQFVEKALSGQLQEQKFGFDKELQGLKSAQGGPDEKKMAAQSGLQTIQRMKELRKQGNLGFRGPSDLFFPEVRKNRGEYEQLGKSLISLASNIPIRNQKEFETLSEQLYDSTISDARAEGILNAMERIISNAAGGEELTSGQSVGKEAPKRFSEIDEDTKLALYEEAGGDKQKFRKLARERGYE